MSCVYCNSNMPDKIEVGNFKLSWNEQGDVTISLIETNGTTMPRSDRFKTFKELFGKKEPKYPMHEVNATAFEVFDSCPVCHTKF